MAKRLSDLYELHTHGNTYHDLDYITANYVNNELRNLSWQDRVIDFYDPGSDLPVNPSVRDRYVASDDGNGWTNNHIYEWDGETWLDITPKNSFILLVESENRNYIYNGSQWVIVESIITHNDLSGIQGNSEGYHLQQSAYDNLKDQNQELYTSSSPTFEDVSITDPNNVYNNLKHDSLQEVNPATPEYLAHVKPGEGLDIDYEGTIFISYDFIDDTSHYYKESYNNEQNITIQHDLNTEDVLVQTFSPVHKLIKPKNVEIVDSNNVRVEFENPTDFTILVKKASGDDVDENSFIGTYTSQDVDITHNLGSFYVLIQVYDSNNLRIQPDIIQILNDNTVRVAFSEEITFTVIINEVPDNSKTVIESHNTDEIIIQHSMSERYVFVDVWNNSENKLIKPNILQLIDSNNVKVEFDSTVDFTIVIRDVIGASSSGFIAWQYSQEENIHEDNITSLSVTQHEGDIDHDALTNYEATEHRQWENSIDQNIHEDNITSLSVTQHEGDIDHDALTNYEATEHRQWENSIDQNIHPDNIQDGEIVHNDLSGLDGGGTTYYYHLKQTAYNNLKDQNQKVYTSSSPTFEYVTAKNAPTDGDHLVRKDYVDGLYQEGMWWQESVIDFYDPSGGLPSSPSDGDRYISTATDNEWYENYIYEYSDTDGSWLEYTPEAGWTLLVDEENRLYYYRNTDEWVKLSNFMYHNTLNGVQGGTEDNKYHLDDVEYGYLSDQDQSVYTTSTPTFDDLSLSNADSIHNDIDHNKLKNYDSDKHVDWTVTGTLTIHNDRITSSNVTQHEGDITHNNLNDVEGSSEGYHLQQSAYNNLKNQDQTLETTDSVTFDDITISNPSNIYNLSHDSFADFNSDEHIDWTVSQTSNIHVDNITSESITQHEGDIDHNVLTNYISNEHIDHSNVSITAGDGLSGGGDLTSNRTLDVRLDIDDSGTNVTGAYGINFSTNINVSDDGDNTVTISVPNDLTVMSNYDTDDLSEGSNNLYYTDSRVDSHLSGGTNINYSSGTISTVNNPSFNMVNFNNNESGDYNNDGDLWHDSSAGFYGYSSNNGGEALIWDNNNVSGGTGISLSTATEGHPTITNSDTGSDAVSSHESTYNHSNFETAYDRSVTGVSGSGNGTLTVNREGVSNVTTDLSHSHSSGDLPSDIVYDSRSVNSGGILSGGGNLTSNRTISLNNSDIDHDSTTNFVSNEHINHSNVSISSGTGLSGGGDLTSDRTLSLDANLDDLNDVDASSPTTDYVLKWDGSNWVPSNVDSVATDTNYYLTDVSGDGNSSVTFTMSGTSDISQDFSHSHSSSDLPSDIVYDSRSVNSGGILSGGGNLTSNRTISLNNSDIDHGSISGLGHDDHTQYLLADGSRDLDGDLTVKGNLNTTGSRIGFNNDDDVLVHNDSNNESLDGFYDNIDGLSVRGDGQESKMVVKSGNFNASNSVYASNKLGAGDFEIKYNSDSNSLDFNWIG